MTSLLSNLANNFAEGICKFKCKNEHNKKTCESVKTNIKVANVFLNAKTLEIL